MRAAREAVAEYYAEHGAAVSADDLVLTTSTSESYSFLFRLLCDPGDEVLVAQPSYPLFDFLADLDDVRLRPYPLFYDHGWWIDFAELERAITPRTRAVIVVHPNNPTGHWTSAAERELLEELCARRGLALIVDEVFLDYPLREASESCGAELCVRGASGADLCAERAEQDCRAAADEGGVDRHAGAGRERAEALGRLEIVADTFLSMNAPVQLALPGWLAGVQGDSGADSERARGNLAVLRRIAEDRPSVLQLLEADAGWSAVLGAATMRRRARLRGAAGAGAGRDGASRMRSTAWRSATGLW